MNYFSLVLILLAYAVTTVNGFMFSPSRRMSQSTKLQMQVNLKSTLAKQGLKAILIASTTFLSANPLLYTSFDDISSGRVSLISASNADSTGKYSTKLTARRRYRPRILNAIPIFQDISQNKISIDASKEFVTSEKFEDLVRAMRLYGVSLRKGELLDDISRKIDSIVDAFEADCKSFTKSVSKETLKSCVADFDDYVKFTEVEQ